MSKHAHALRQRHRATDGLQCPPSAKRCASVPDQSSEYARQGTAAHELCQYKVEHALGRNTRDPTEDLDYFRRGDGPSVPISTALM
jgi:hypothetical protein